MTNKEKESQVKHNTNLSMKKKESTEKRNRELQKQPENKEQNYN